MSRASRSLLTPRVRGLATAAALATAVPLMLTAGPAAAAPRAAVAPATAHRAAAPRVVTLPTGLRVVVRTDAGRTSVSVAPGSVGSYVSASLGGATYVIPTAAAPGLGTRYPLADFLVAGTAPSAGAPAFRQYTVTVAATNRRGGPSTNDLVFLQNVDDGRAPSYTGVTRGGSAAFSIPAGHYFLTGFFFSGRSVSLPVRSEVTVTGTQTLTLDARTATATPTTTTPRPSTVLDAELTITRTAQRHGFPFSYIAGGSADAPVFVTPVATRPAHGTLSSDTYLRSGGDGYVYDADYPSPRSIPIPADQDFAPPASAFASGTTRYFSDGPTVQALENRTDFAPGVFFVVRALLPVDRPSARTDYVLADPDLTWSQTVIADADAFVGIGEADDTIYAPGDSTSADWFRPAAHPAPIFPYGGYCSACRQGDALQVDYQDFGDADPTHLTFDDFPGTPGLDESITFTVASGDQILDTEPGMFTQLNGLPPQTLPYTFHEVTTRSGDGFALSTHTDTVWTVPSGVRSGLPVPPSEFCILPTARGCRALPVITPTFTLPVALNGVVPAGPTSVGLTLTSPLGRSFPGLTSVAVSVSYDGGATSEPATVTRTGDGYAVSFFAPAASSGGRYADLTVTAHAVDGASVTQTISRAFALAATGSGTRAGRSSGGALPAGCATATAGHARCYALVSTAGRAATATQQRAAGASAALPDGYGPADIEAAYDLPATANVGRTVAVVDAFSDPHAASDLATYRKTYGLPACTTASGCLRIVDQRGGSTLPAPDPGWAEEISLDLDAVSAACPGCRILLVETDDNSFASLGAGVDRAVRLGATAVSNSYGTDEFKGMAPYARDYDHPGTAITVSSGDFGFGPAQFPAVLDSVTAVGGTTLTAVGDGTYASSAWYGSGSGCSAYVAKPAWQHDRHCSMRTTTDVSTVADPNTGLAVYDSYETGYDSNWLVVGGTSASSPVVAAIYTLAGSTAGLRDASALYAAPRGSITDVRGGSNGYCGGDYLCTGVRGYDGPTGVGSPHGTAAFG